VTDTPIEHEGEGAWAKLRRRKVVQWGLAYLAGGWTLLQVVEYLAETYAWPPAIRQLAIPAIALGLLPVVVIAWHHGDRGAQKVSRAEVLALGLVALAFGGSMWWYAARLDPATWATGGAREPAHAIPSDARSIAVLPFEDMSPARNQQYFSDGLSEELLNLLIRVPQLRVTSRTSSFSFRGRRVPLAAIAGQLNVAHVLQGSVRMSGNRVRISAQLIDARRDVSVWSETYDRTLDDVFAVQDEIASAVAGALKVKLLGAPTPTAARTSPEAYTLYLQGKELVDAQSAEGRSRGIGLLQRALAVAPDYAPAWTALGHAYWIQAMYGELPLKPGVDLARGAVEKALAADQRYAPAHARLAAIERDYDWNFPSARRHLNTALAVAPTDNVVLKEASKFLSYIGQADQATRIARWMVARDPLNPDAVAELGGALYVSAEYAESESAYRRVLARKPAASAYHYVIGETRLLRGDPKGALEENDKEPVETLKQFGRAVIYPSLGRSDEARALLEQLGKDHADWSIAMAEGYAALGDTDAAFHWLERGFLERDPGMTQVRTDVLLKSLHGDPRWPKILDRIGLSDRQVAALTLEVRLPQ
jgi:TolB-like protein